VKDLVWGTFVVEDEELYRIDSVHGPIPMTWGAYELRLFRVGTGTVAEVRRPRNWEAEKAHLADRVLSYSYRTATNYVLHDSTTGEEFRVRLDLGGGSLCRIQSGCPVIASFWKGQPVTFRDANQEA
jgi:translation elongation factor P/translation initiation factor 5A